MDKKAFRSMGVFSFSYGVGGNSVNSSLSGHRIMNHEPTFNNYATFLPSNHRIIVSSTMCLRLERGTRGSAKPNWEMQQHVRLPSLYKKLVG
jgi:hypothetical protein